ncbi:MAG: substrate-binding domain-containing protein, partial [Brevinematia bacterium]
PVGIGGKGNPGVAGYVKQTPGAIGYVEVAYAKQNKIPFAMLKNKSGNFIDATLKAVSMAADTDIPKDTIVSLVNTDAKDGYPIVTFTWIIVYKEQNYGGRPKTRAKQLKDLLWWMTHNGQRFNEELEYGRLPEKTVKIVEDIINSITYNGEKL